MTSTSAVPSSSLTVSGNDNQFTLFTDDWLNLQSYISSALMLPISQGDFTAKYGSFQTGDQTEVTGCIAAMKSVNGLSASFGDPTSIKAKISSNPSYLDGTTPPAELYGNMIWLAAQIQNQASTFTETFSQLKMVFTGTQAQNAANLKTLLTGQGGLVSTANTAKDQVGKLTTKLLAFDKEFTSANTSLQKYTSDASAILKAANTAVGGLTTLIATTQSQADSAHKQWKDETIAATSASIGITIMSAGILLPLGAAVGTTLGVLASKALASYNSLCTEITKDQATKKQKAQLVTDLTGLNTMMINVSPAMTAFKTSLTQIEGVWTDISTSLAYIANNYTDKELGDLTWVMQAMNILDAQKKWQVISDSAQIFVQSSMATYTTETFGQPVAA